MFAVTQARMLQTHGKKIIPWLDSKINFYKQVGLLY